KRTTTSLQPKHPSQQGDFMASSVSSVQGLASGIQWKDLVDQLTTIDQTRELDPITASISASQKQSDAWGAYQQVSQQLFSAVAGLKDGSALDSFQTSTPNSPSSGRTLFSATAQAGAVPGTYQVEVLDVARAEKLSGGAFASGSTALGLSAGDFAVNGIKIGITAADTLSSIRDKINAVNSGTNASGVTATVLGTSNGSSRLVLSSDNAGARGIELLDSASSNGALQQLGLIDGTYAGGTNANGTSTSGGFSSSSAAIGQLFGMSYPAPAQIRVGNRIITVDLATDSLSSLVAKIAAVGINASVSTTIENGVTRSRLQVDAGLSAVPSAGNAAVPDPDSLRTLQMLGVVQGGRSAIAQSISSTALTDAADVIATGATLLSDVKANGASANIQTGDQVTVSGLRGDGSAVSFSLNVGAGTTLDDLVTQLNAPPRRRHGWRLADHTLARRQQEWREWWRHNEHRSLWRRDNRARSRSHGRERRAHSGRRRVVHSPIEQRDRRNWRSHAVVATGGSEHHRQRIRRA
ncbi:MAG: flagellar cap protein FliD N-terminal domain-containing protein, partial [bacterium]